MMKDSTIPRPMGMSHEDFNAAQERGRKMAERAVAHDPLKRIQLETIFGVEYCKARYPAAYREVIQ